MDASAAVFDPSAPIRIADRVWWVGNHRPGEPFQCHSYLVEHGDQSVLIDPGSPLGFPQVAAKVERVMPFDRIRYFVCHHQDPDITSCLPQLDAMVTRADASILAHWRAIVLLDGYDLKMPMVCVERGLDWTLDLGGRLLRFAFTPYAHFPGAFCTFDTASQVMFSSDLFGGFSEGAGLYARDEGYFENLRPFHEHYIPSREVLVHAVKQIERHPVRMIAPQHGCIIPEPLVAFFLEKIKSIECGLFLLAVTNSDIERLSQLNRTLRDITRSMIIYRDFRDIVAALTESIRRLVPVEALEFWSRADGDELLHLSAANRFHGVLAPAPAAILACLDQSAGCDCQGDARQARIEWRDESGTTWPAIRVPLARDDDPGLQGVALVLLREDVTFDEHLDILLDRIRRPLQVALEREALYRMVDIQRQRFFEHSIRDPLTGLFNRFYMADTVQRLADIQDHDANAPVAVAMIDIDHFKTINDTHGHAQGDRVLRAVAEQILANMRSADVPVRFGGEEFAVFTAGASAHAIATIAERIRAAIAGLVLDEPLHHRRVTVSIGVAIRQRGEELSALLERADAALYAAKNAGRDRVCRAD